MAAAGPCRSSFRVYRPNGRERALAVYDLHLAELAGTFPPERAAVFRFAQHDTPIRHLRILAELATAADRPALARQAQSFLRPGEDVPEHTGPPVTRRRLREIGSLYGRATRAISRLYSRR